MWSGHALMTRLLSLQHSPTAVSVGKDEQSFGVYRALYESGLRAPDDMSVVGFDDMPYASWMTPPLTTIRQPLVEMGRVATTMLLLLIGEEPVHNDRVDHGTTVIKRSSRTA